MSTQIQERRKSVRFNAPFSINLFDHHPSQEVSGIIKDLSYTGARVILDNFLATAISETVLLLIRFPQDSLKVNGRVVWAKDLGDKKEVGLSFLNIRDAEKEIINNRIFKYYKQEFIQRWWQ